jgi:GMP reductase
MTTVGTVEMANSLAKYKCMTALHKYITDKELSELSQEAKEYTFLTFGMFESIKQIQEKIDIIGWKQNEINLCFDIANGGMNLFLNVIADARRYFPHAVIIAGNVATQSCCKRLFAAGADIVKCGIANGVACRTKNKTGVNYPQFSMILECAEAKQRFKSKGYGLIISDGGCKEPGDICKAFGAGAHFVMLGGMLSGHYECITPYNPLVNGKTKFYGMASDLAVKNYNGGMDNYRTSEGAVISVDCKGPVNNTIEDILGGLRSCCSYSGAHHLQNLYDYVEFGVRY